MSRIARNSLYQLLSQGALLATAVFTTPYIVHKLGPDLYGLLVLIGITTNYFGVVELGLGQATIKFMADSYSRRDWPEFRRVFWTSSVSYLVLGGIGAGAMLSCTPLLLHFLKIPSYARGDAIRAFIISAAGLIVSLQVGVTSSVVRALERFEFLSSIGLATGLSQALLTVLLLYLKFSLVGVIAGGAALQLGALIAYSFLVRLLAPGLGKPAWNGKTFGGLAGFGAYVSVSQIIGPLLVHLEKFMVGSLLTMALVTYYTVPYGLVYSLSVIPTSVAIVIFPAFTRLYAEGNKERARELYTRATKFVFGCVLSLAVVLCVFARQILTAWIGADFGTRGTQVMQILAFAVVVNAVASIPFQFLQAIHRPDLTAKFHVLELIIHVPLCFGLITTFGLAGAALGWAARVTLDMVLLVRWAAEHVGLGVGDLFRHSFRASMIGAGVAAPVVIASRLAIHNSGRIATLVSVGITGALYSIAVMALTLDAEDKFYLTPFLSRLRHSSAP